MRCRVWFSLCLLFVLSPTHMQALPVKVVSSLKGKRQTSKQSLNSDYLLELLIGLREVREELKKKKRKIKYKIKKVSLPFRKSLKASPCPLPVLYLLPVYFLLAVIHLNKIYCNKHVIQSFL